MKCAKCGANNPATNNYCSNCGEPFKNNIFCSQCGKELKQGKLYCSYCGARIKKSPGAARRADNFFPSGKRNPKRAKAVQRHGLSSRLVSRGIMVAAGAVVLVIIISWVVSWLPSSRSNNLNVGSGTNVVWSAEVREVAANFNCPCEKCGVARLDICTCDIPRGAVEVKSYIQTLLNEGLSGEEVIRKIEERYGNRI